MPNVYRSSPLLRGSAGALDSDMIQRPGEFFIKTGYRLDQHKVEAFCRAVLPKSLHVRGVFKGKDDVWYSADGMKDHLRVQPLGTEAEESFFIVTPCPHIDLRSSVRRAWMQYCGVCFTLS